MKVHLIASTEFYCKPVADFDWPEEEFESADFLAEFAGRACYQSWSRPNPKTATNQGYINNILQQGHESVLEHASATFYIEGVSRALTHELIRHRHLSFSQLSQRYVDESDSYMTMPPAIQVLDSLEQTEYWAETERAKTDYGYWVEVLSDAGLSRKQAREAARAVLPNATETKIVVTGNLRAWRDVLKKRHHVTADAEIQALAKEILKQLRLIAPNSFQDIPDEPYGSL